MCPKIASSGIMCSTFPKLYYNEFHFKEIASKSEKNDYIKRTLVGQFTPHGELAFYQPFSIVYALNNEFVCSVFLQKTGYEILVGEDRLEVFRADPIIIEVFYIIGNNGDSLSAVSDF